MKDPQKTPQQGTHSSDGTNPAAPSRSAYSSPVLTVYGTVGNLTRGTGVTVVGDNGSFQMAKSDRRAKENIVRVGTHPLGIGLYLFDYLPEHRGQSGHGRQFGVMADEVEAVMPTAVSTDADGYKRVNYAMLGVRHPVH